MSWCICTRMSSLVISINQGSVPSPQVSPPRSLECTSHSTICVRAFLPRTCPLRSFPPGRVVLHFQSASQSTCSETPGLGGTSFSKLPFSPPWKPESSRYVFSRPKRPKILTAPSARILLKKEATIGFGSKVLNLPARPQGTRKSLSSSDPRTAIASA